MKLSVIIPHYNEKTYVAEILRRVEAVPLDKEIILVDDGSSEEVRAYLKKEVDGRFPDLRIYYHEHNQGKGAAIRTALRHVRGDIVIIQEERDGAIYASVKEFIRKTDTELVALQYNPEAELRFKLKHVRTVHRVLPWRELLGI